MSNADTLNLKYKDENSQLRSAVTKLTSENSVLRNKLLQITSLLKPKNASQGEIPDSQLPNSDLLEKIISSEILHKEPKENAPKFFNDFVDENQKNAHENQNERNEGNDICLTG